MRGPLCGCEHGSRGATAGGGRQEGADHHPPSERPRASTGGRPQVAARGFTGARCLGTFERMIRGRSLRLGVLLCALVVPAGCQGDAGSAPTSTSPSTKSSRAGASAGGSGTSSGMPTVSTKSTSSGSSSTTDGPSLSVPKAARQNTDAGAEAFARFYLEVVNRAWRLPDPNLLRPLALPTCRTCANLVATAEDLLKTKQHYAGDAGLVGRSVVAPGTSTGRAVIELVYDQRATEIVDRSGKRIERVRSKKSQSQVTLQWRAPQGWRVSEIKLIAVS
jgi:hypothetical protein